jgi:hypothetical protein
MLIAVFTSAILFAAEATTRVALKAPSCEILSAFAVGARQDPVEISFGKPPRAMSVAEFDQAIDVVEVCIDQIEALPPDTPYLTLYERKRPRLIALRQFVEDLAFYRSEQRERERRAARNRQTTQPQSEE